MRITGAKYIRTLLSTQWQPCNGSATLRGVSMECFMVVFGWGGRRGRHVAFVFLRVEGGLEEMVEAVKQWGCCRERVWGN